MSEAQEHETELNVAETDPAPVAEVNAAPLDPALLPVILSAVNAAAGLIYHPVVNVEADVSKWSADHPAVGAFIDDAAQQADTILNSFGVHVPFSLATLVHSALSVLAAHDPTVRSGST